MGGTGAAGGGGAGAMRPAWGGSGGYGSGLGTWGWGGGQSYGRSMSPMGGYGGYGNQMYYTQPSQTGTSTPPTVQTDASGKPLSWSPYGSTGNTYYRDPYGRLISAPAGAQITADQLNALPQLTQGNWGTWDTTLGRPGTVNVGNGINLAWDPTTSLYDKAPTYTAPSGLTGDALTNWQNQYNQYQNYVTNNRPIIPGVTATAPPAGFFGPTNYWSQFVSGGM